MHHYWICVGFHKHSLFRPTSQPNRCSRASIHHFQCISGHLHQFSLRIWRRLFQHTDLLHHWRNLQRRFSSWVCSFQVHTISFLCYSLLLFRIYWASGNQMLLLNFCLLCMLFHENSTSFSVATLDPSGLHCGWNCLFLHAWVQNKNTFKARANIWHRRC